MDPIKAAKLAETARLLATPPGEAISADASVEALVGEEAALKIKASIDSLEQLDAIVGSLNADMAKEMEEKAHDHDKNDQSDAQSDDGDFLNRILSGDELSVEEEEEEVVLPTSEKISFSMPDEPNIEALDNMVGTLEDQIYTLSVTVEKIGYRMMTLGMQMQTMGANIEAIGQKITGKVTSKK